MKTGGLVAHSLLEFPPMNYQCQHCGQFIMGKAYRVISEESGIRLLDMTVCYYCYIDAQRLGLSAEEIRPRDLPPVARYQHTPS